MVVWFSLRRRRPVDRLAVSGEIGELSTSASNSGDTTDTAEDKPKSSAVERVKSERVAVECDKKLVTLTAVEVLFTTDIAEHLAHIKGKVSSRLLGDLVDKCCEHPAGHITVETLGRLARDCENVSELIAPLESFRDGGNLIECSRDLCESLLVMRSSSTSLDFDRILHYCFYDLFVYLFFVLKY